VGGLSEATRYSRTTNYRRRGCTSSLRDALAARMAPPIPHSYVRTYDYDYYSRDFFAYIYIYISTYASCVCVCLSSAAAPRMYLL
jgi:hypothetical protein